MHIKKLKLAQKLIRKNKNREGIEILLKVIGEIIESNIPLKQDNQEAGQLLASIFLVKGNRAIIFEYIKNLKQSYVIYFLHIVVDFGQLKGAIFGLEELYSLKKMELETLNFYLDILDSFMERKKALSVAHEYLTIHHHLSLGELSATRFLDIWDKHISQEIKGTIANQEHDIELFSLFFKIVKILYCEGRLVEAETIVNTLQPMITCNQELQTSKIKNGFNYFQYIAKLLPLKKQPNQDVTRTIYMVGDSHCLSPAWDTIAINSIHYQIIPLLVTGCKIWHLRNNSTFHAKTNFYQAMEHIPQNSVAIFIFGEIDCREGILQEVIKGTYASSTKAIEKLIDIYIKRIMEIIKLRS
ncbi:MAG: hypothetical protein HYX60_04030, partial [Legionella longbeachae]|nr:hypothetical protein [Legionella longbeachae]